MTIWRDRRGVTAVVFALELTHDMNAMLPMLVATGVSYGFSVLTQRRSIMTEKISRRGLHTYREYSVDPLEWTSVGELMTPDFVAIAGDQPLAEAIATHFGAEQEHHAFPVVDKQGRVLGMLDRSLFVGLPKEKRLQATGLLFADAVPRFALESETCRAVAGRMAAYRLERLPVVADARSLQLIGVISRSDLIQSGQTVFDEERREKLRTFRLPLPFFRRR